MLRRTPRSTRTDTLFPYTTLCRSLWTVVGGHLAKDLHVRRGEGTIWQDVKDHARLRFPTGAAAARYSVLQKLAYIGVLFGLLPLMIATGLAMAPGYNATAPWLVDL